MGLKGILSLLSKAGKRVFSPATQARNKMASYSKDLRKEISPASQMRKEIGSLDPVMGTIATASVAKNAMAKSKQVVDRLITNGQIPLERREEVMRKLMAEIAETLKNAAMPVDPNALAQATLAKVLVSLGIGGAVGYGIAENKAENEALQQMEEETQIGPVEGYFKDVGFGERDWKKGGEATANLLMDIISPIPRQ